MTAGLRGRRASGVQEAEPSPVVSLLLFEAADCLMALPVSEVSQLLAQPGSGGPEQGASATVTRVDLDDYFTGHPSSGPWLRWDRRDRGVWLRIVRVVEVLPYAIRGLAPIPAALRRTGRAGAFWAAGVRGDDVFLLVDPVRVMDQREG